MDLRVLLFAFLVASIAGLAFGIVPALEARRSDFSGILRSASITTTAGRAHLRHRGLLVILQTALAAILVAGAALLANSVLRLANVQPGFDPSNVVWVDVSLPERAYAGPAAKVLYFDALLERLKASAGTGAAGLIQGRPLGGGNSVTTVAPEGELPLQGQQSPRVPAHVVAPGYFSVLRIPLLDGRDFNADDDRRPPESRLQPRLADRFWPGERGRPSTLASDELPPTPPLKLSASSKTCGNGSMTPDPFYRAYGQLPAPPPSWCATTGDPH